MARGPGAGNWWAGEGRDAAATSLDVGEVYRYSSFFEAALATLVASVALLNDMFVKGGFASSKVMSMSPPSLKAADRSMSGM